MPDSVFSTPLFASPGRDYRGRYVHPVEDARYAGIALSLVQSGTDNIRNTNLRQACDDASRSRSTSLALICLCLVLPLPGPTLPLPGESFAQDSH